MSLIEKPQLLRNSTNFDNPQSSYRGERNGSSKKSINYLNIFRLTNLKTKQI